MNDFGERRWEIGEAFISARPPNFLQKLYDFLSLDPHPCPEVIYWASDSRQLVIAQPERLVREVLPKLFKHDKLSSFGRQLNIYGFSRLFPGRQFKDSNGSISDASVWAHPTLHRLSTPAEVSAIKRRAAPKLFRTRRLANGQLVRTRAGPAVEAKAREMRESIAESKRQRGGSQSFYAGAYEEEPQITPMTGRFNSPPMDAGQLHHSFLDTSGWQEKSRLADIAEDVVAHDSTPMFVVKQEQENVDFERQAPHTNQGERALQSCPASIHSTPVPARLALNHVTWDMFNNTTSSLSTGVDAHKPQVQGISPVGQSPWTAYPLSPPNGNWSASLTVTQTPQVMNNGLSDTLNHSMETHEVKRRLSWESDQSTADQGQGTIDPRWVSPLSSVWNTPAATPSTGSPVLSHVIPAPLIDLPDFLQANISVLAQAAHPFGTQSYPPRITERRQRESQAVPVFSEQPLSSAPFHTQLMGGSVMPPPSLPAHIGGGVSTSIGGGKWFH